MEIHLTQILNGLVIIVPILVIVLGRKYYPNKFWVAMVMSILFVPIGHFYVKKGMGYVFIILLNLLLFSLVIENVFFLAGLGCVISAVLMFFRFKLKSIKTIEQDG